MGLFSTSNITCNERSSVGRNFRDTINESSSPINRFTEKPDTRSFDEIFYEADIAIREASNSMNKLWYKSVLESDTVESAIINEANIFSKMIEVIKTIFDAIKKAISSWVKKARTLLQKIFKKKPANKSDSKESSKSNVRSTDKESTPTDKVEEIKSKKDELEREKKELQSKLKEVKKTEEKKKKAETQSGSIKDKKPDSSDDSISTSNIDTSSLDTSNKKNQSDKMDTISVPELEKKSKEIDDELKKVDDELKVAKKEASSIPQSKPTSTSTTTQSKDKVDTESSSGNDDVSALYNEYISDIEGNWEKINSVFYKYRNTIKNGPKITPYIDLFKLPDDFHEEIDMYSLFRKVFGHLYFSSSGDNYCNAIYLVSQFLYAESDNKIKKNIDFFMEKNSVRIDQYRRYLNSNNAISDKVKNEIAAGFIGDIANAGSGFNLIYVDADKLKNASPLVKNLDNAFKGGKINDEVNAETPVDISVSEFKDIQIIRFLDNIKTMKKNNSNTLKYIEDGLKSIDNAKNTFIKKANFIMSTIKNRTQELSYDKDTYQYYCNEFTPVIQKSIVECISSVASVINQVFSTRIKIYTEAYARGNAWFDSCLKLCIAAKLADENKK